MKWNSLKRYLYAVLLLAMVAGFFLIGTQRLTVNNDITAALPQSDPVVAAGRRILLSYPALDNVIIDLSLSDGSVSREELTRAGDFVVGKLEKYGLVKVTVGKAGAAAAAAAYGTVTDHLPLFFFLSTTCHGGDAFITTGKD
jgi:predicted RND superfamily exporter protein